MVSNEELLKQYGKLCVCVASLDIGMANMADEDPEDEEYDGQNYYNVSEAASSIKGVLSIIENDILERMNHD